MEYWLKVVSPFLFPLFEREFPHRQECVSFFFTPAPHFLNSLQTRAGPDFTPPGNLSLRSPFIPSCILKARLFLAQFYLCPGKNPSHFYLAVRASSAPSTGCTADLHSVPSLLTHKHPTCWLLPPPLPSHPHLPSPPLPPLCLPALWSLFSYLEKSALVFPRIISYLL